MKSSVARFLSLILFLISSIPALAYAPLMRSGKPSKNRPYIHGIGASYGLNYGLSYKHFFAEEDAIEVTLASRWKGGFITGLYKKCIAPDGPGTAFRWVFGGGPRVGFYNGKNYKDYLGLNRDEKTYTLVGIAGTIGFEVFMVKLPFTLGLEYRPFFDLIGKDDSFIDGVVSARFVF